jgi:endonuclease/exonuclease/phosphatase (EEP) superfamily protein YafD
MRGLWFTVAAAALLAAGAATAVGYLAPWWPWADIANQFAPFVLASAVAGLALALLQLRKPWTPRWLRMALAVGLTGVAAVSAVPVLRAVATGAAAAHGPADTLTVVSFNVWTRNPRLDEVTRWLAAQDADVIVLQEMTRRNRDPIKHALAATHPYIHDCRCNDIVMYSRRPWTTAGGQPRAAKQPAMSWFTLTGRDGREVRVVGLRPRYINNPQKYAADYNWLVRHVEELSGRVILAGDFNAAPWSWQMTRLVAAGGLRRHGTFAASWPARLPVVLIDNVLSTPDIRSVSFRTGPDLGSDHLPVVATVALP